MTILKNLHVLVKKLTIKNSELEVSWRNLSSPVINNNTGINVSQDSNRWKIMNESIKIQSGIPAQSGIYPDGSDVGVYVSPIDPQQLP